MGNIYRRGNKLWLAFYDANGKRVRRSSGLMVGEEAKAEAVLRSIERQIKAGQELGGLTVRGYSRQWLKSRTNKSKRDDVSRLKLHVLPVIGSMRIDEVRPLDIRKLILGLKSKGLAPRTQSNIYALLRALFRDALAEELIDKNPVLLKKSEVPKRRDKKARWRESAQFTAGELALLISSPRVPMGRRVLWGLQGACGMRFGEAAARRWGDILDKRPLRGIMVDTAYDTKAKVIRDETKTGSVRFVPMPDLLHDELERWRRVGWPAMYGRSPTDNDLITPADSGRIRNVNNSLRQLHFDCVELGIPERRQHDLRRTFISLCRAKGAPSDLVKFLSHGRSGAVLDQYTTLPWRTLCEIVPVLLTQRCHSESKVIDIKGKKWRAGRDLNPPESGMEKHDYPMLDMQTIEIFGDLFLQDEGKS